ncbi:hypothetical protein M407DRAFT_16933 [Tulasnella calospora MUT 4182]|uniref:Rubisco LSMT substrate-binding domain-containing protein n=1 Tax=Tulasnella calospora MUT 4182 TaxID=1051891 RepID=A0A0C3QMW4_9AGAM|nr:hypothetical protein M407DRAFT_16933 [Tulasnella calospora MUT 4182]
MSQSVDSTQDWNALVAHVTSAGGFVGPITLKDVPGAGRGLFLTEDVEAYQTLVSIPKAALMNWHTIRQYYPRLKLNTNGVAPAKTNPKSTTLNSTQALTMHLYLLRRGESSAEMDAYSSGLPRSFDEHPLTWVGTPRESLLEVLPPFSKTALTDVENRCKVDWKAVRDILEEQTVDPSSKHHSDCSTSKNAEAGYRIFVWAWLCVNTRCIHFSLSLSNIARSLKDVDLTLCPIIDLANHALSKLRSFSVRRDTSDSSLNLEAPMFPMRKGDEVFFHYSAHSNSTLFSEYGFVIPRNPRPSEDDEPQEGGEVNIDDVVAALFEDENIRWKKEMLEETGYWGDWTLHSSPPPAHPSYRVVAALRLLHASRKEADQWEDMIFGGRDVVHETNERLMRATVRSICQQVADRASKKVVELSTGPWESRDSAPDVLTCYALDCVRTLWEEEHDVSVGVIESIDRNEEF